VELQKDFRDSYKCATDDHYDSATLELDIEPFNAAKEIVYTQYSDRGTLMGCRNPSLTRTTNCEPPGGFAVGKIGRVSAGPVDWSRPVPIGTIVVMAIAVAMVVVRSRRARAVALAAARDVLLDAGARGDGAS
jgi:hypothetical protein